VAVWPVEVSAGRTAVALAVGGLIAVGRPAGSVPPVVCAGKPPMRRSRPTVCHEVRAEVGGRRVALVVWELLPLPRLAVSGLVETSKAAA